MRIGGSIAFWKLCSRLYFCSSSTANAPANRQMPIASVVMPHFRIKRNMKQKLIIILLLVSNFLCAQELIGTPTSLILVYNYPENYFYLYLNGKDKQKTENENVFVIDNKVVQVKTLNKTKFIKNTKQDLSFIDFMKTYIIWEKSYLEETFSFNINSKVEFLKTNKGRDFAFWTYDMPLNNNKQKTDLTITTPTQKQIFVLTRVKDYLIGINSPLFEKDKFDTIKSYLISSIEGIVESKNEIDVEALNRKLKN